MPRRAILLGLLLMRNFAQITLHSISAKATIFHKYEKVPCPILLHRVVRRT